MAYVAYAYCSVNVMCIYKLSRMLHILVTYLTIKLIKPHLKMATDTSSSEDELSITVIASYIRQRRRKRPKSFWVRSIYAKRREQGKYHNLFKKMRLSDDESHFGYLRMSRERFDLLLSQVKAINLYLCFN